MLKMLFFRHALSCYFSTETPELMVMFCLVCERKIDPTLPLMTVVEDIVRPLFEEDVELRQIENESNLWMKGL